MVEFIRNIRIEIDFDSVDKASKNVFNLFELCYLFSVLCFTLTIHNKILYRLSRAETLIIKL